MHRGRGGARPHLLQSKCTMLDDRCSSLGMKMLVLQGLKGIGFWLRGGNANDEQHQHVQDFWKKQLTSPR